MLDAYLNFLLGRGSGSGWDLESEIQAAIAAVHREDPLIFDVGANVGEWSASFLRAQPRARILAFEPSPVCCDGIRALNLAQVTLIPSGVGESRGRAILHARSGSDSSASLYQRQDSYLKQGKTTTTEVEVVSIDEIIRDRGYDFVDYIKMDIEGHELSALRGAEESLGAGRIGAISFEFGSGNVNSRTFFRDFWQVLTTKGYSISRVAPGRNIAIREYYEDDEYFRGVSNYIARLDNHPYWNGKDES